MSDSFDAIDPPDLLAHVDWVRGLARRLVADPALADDLVQETWIAAQAAPGPRAGHEKGWLARILKNRISMVRRSGARRGRREVEAARSEALPSTVELVERAARQREVVGEVLALDEPFRTTVLLRWFDELTPNEIAERQGVPVKTVHSRLGRAYARLRERLEDRHGGREGMLAAFTPWLLAAPRGGGVAVGGGESAGPEASGSGTTATTAGSVSSAAEVAGVLGMSVQIKWGVAAAGAVLASLAVWRGLEPAAEAGGAAGEDAATASLELPAPVEPAAPAATREGEPQREQVASLAAPPAVPEVVARPTVPVVGIVVDVEGEPVPDVAVVEVGGSEELSARTDAEGRFALDVPGALEPESDEERISVHNLGVDADGWLNVRRTRVTRDDVDSEHVIVVARATRLEVAVVDGQGFGIADARLALARRQTTFYGFEYPLENSMQVGYSGRAEDDGRVVVDPFPDVPGQSVTVSATGYRSLTVDLDELTQPYVVELTALADAVTDRIEGVVVTPTGFPVEGAKVELGWSETTTDAEGRFELRMSFMTIGDQMGLCASAKGYLPAVVERFKSVINASDGRPDPLELVLGPEPLTLSGRVVDQDGNPQPRWQVRLTDETVISQYMVPPRTAEGVAREWVGAAWTDEDGRFEVGGLYDREYRVQAIGEETLLRVEGVGAPGQGELVLTVTEQLVGPIEGVVVDRQGEVVVDAEVAVVRDVIRNETGRSWLTGTTARTDADGAFRIESAPEEGGYLTVSGADVLATTVEPEEPLGSEPLRLVVDRRCRVRVELADTELADSVQFLDADGRSLSAAIVTAQGMSSSNVTDLVDGRSEMVIVSDAVVEVRFSKAGEEVGRTSVRLDPAVVNTVHY